MPSVRCTEYVAVKRALTYQQLANMSEPWPCATRDTWVCDPLTPTGAARKLPVMKVADIIAAVVPGRGPGGTPTGPPAHILSTPSSVRTATSAAMSSSEGSRSAASGGTVTGSSGAARYLQRKSHELDDEDDAGGFVSPPSGGRGAKAPRVGDYSSAPLMTPPASGFGAASFAGSGESSTSARSNGASSGRGPGPAYPDDTPTAAERAKLVEWVHAEVGARGENVRKIVEAMETDADVLNMDDLVATTKKVGPELFSRTVGTAAGLSELQIVKLLRAAAELVCAPRA